MAMATEADTRTDEHIQRDVRAELEWEARVRPNEIGVAVKKWGRDVDGLGGLLPEEMGRGGGRASGAWLAGRGQ